jgi:tRNA-dihydrouridine synthase A
MASHLKENECRGPIWPVSIAPMMDWSDRHYRYFMRQITRRTLLYTEMKTTGAVLFGNREKILGFSEAERPLALQLGGDDPRELAESARIVEDMGYDEVNINVGCPSERVQKGSFGACLMAQPEMVARGVEAMRKAVSIPVSVKHRIGINGLERYEDLKNFVNIVAAAGCDRFTVHARIAVLGGLTPRKNRSVPPLRYEDVYRLKEEFPQLIIELNGGIKSTAEIAVHLRRVNGAMIGRAAYENPYLFAAVDSLFYDDNRQPLSRREVIETMARYLETQITRGIYPNRITRHMPGLFHHQPGAKFWKRYLSENAHKPGSGSHILLKAIEGIPDEVLDERPQINRAMESLT